MKQIASRLLFPFALLAALALSGCADAPNIVRTETKPGETYSPDEVRYRTVDQPFMTTGDYFRERDREPGTTLDLSGDEETKSPPKSGDAPASEAPRAAATAETPAPSAPRAAPAVPRGPSTPVKVALAVDGEKVAPEIADALTPALLRAAEGLPVVVAAPDRVTEVMTGPACPQARDLGCLSAALSVYPGARMVLLVERVGFPNRYPGHLQAQLTAVDAGLGFRYPVMAVTAPVETPNDGRTALAAVMQKALAFCVDRSGIMPWFCRSFSREGEEWYISAGARSGLKPGDRLRVVPGGRVVKSPAGTPAGWLPEAPTGIVEVTLLFGPDFAACRLVKGRGPTPGDLLMRR